MNTAHDNSKQMIASDIYDICYLEGDFTLRSGRRASHYFDKYQFESDPRLLAKIAALMVPLIPSDTEVLAGLEMGGIPVVTALSQASGLPAAFIRKTAKEHGTARFAEGTPLDGKRVLVIEDVVTSGGQIILSTDDLRSIGAIVKTALCVVDRQEGGEEALEKHDVALISLFYANEITKDK